MFMETLGRTFFGEATTLNDRVSEFLLNFPSELFKDRK